MKLESLKSSKFEAFKENELQNAFRIVGGDVLCTYKDKVPNDHLDNTTYRSTSTIDKFEKCDFSNEPCNE